MHESGCDAVDGSSAQRETVKDTAHAKVIVAELSDMMLNRSKEI